MKYVVATVAGAVVGGALVITGAAAGIREANDRAGMARQGMEAAMKAARDQATELGEARKTITELRKLTGKSLDDVTKEADSGR